MECVEFWLLFRVKENYMSDEKIKQLIKDGHMTTYQIYKKYKLFLTMTIYFDNHKPVDIMRYKWEEYWDILDEAEKNTW